MLDTWLDMLLAMPSPYLSHSKHLGTSWAREPPGLAASRQLQVHVEAKALELLGCSCRHSFVPAHRADWERKGALAAIA